jgi:hypothetical protein
MKGLNITLSIIAAYVNQKSHSISNKDLSKSCYFIVLGKNEIRPFLRILSTVFYKNL